MLTMLIWGRLLLAVETRTRPRCNGPLAPFTSMYLLLDLGREVLNLLLFMRTELFLMLVILI